MYVMSNPHATYASEYPTFAKSRKPWLLRRIIPSPAVAVVMPTTCIVRLDAVSLIL